ncbi:HEAT repeat domain-containing protein [Neisseriaceae bacterium JH1-16]|nr:HEAT repeat domain-containing protein [Neisseriaceae bacterium JH1-16]
MRSTPRRLRALGLAEGNEVQPALLTAPGDTEWEVFKEAAIALGEIGSATALPALSLAEADPDPEVRRRPGWLSSVSGWLKPLLSIWL